MSGRGLTRINTDFVMAFALIGVVFATISTVAAQPTPVPGEEAGVPWGYIAIGAVLLLLVALWMPRKQPAGGEGGDAEAAWWATKKGREMITTLLLLFSIMAGLKYAGMKALIAGGFLFVAWMVYRYFFGGDKEVEGVTTQKLADEIADEMEDRGMVELDSHRDVYGQFLPSLGLHLIQFSHPTTLVYIKNVKTGERGGPLCLTLNEAIEKIYEKRELWMPPAWKGEKKEPLISQIGAEEGGVE